MKIRLLFLIVIMIFKFGFTGEIHKNIMSGEINMVKLLLQKNPKLINERDENGYTPLHIAVICNLKEMVNLLLEKGSEINAIDNMGWTPLKIAYEGEFTEIIEVLRCSGGFIPEDIHEAIINGDIKKVKILLEKNERFIGYRDKNNLTPLHLAVIYNFYNISKLLIEEGADVNALELVYGNTSLHFACINGNKKIVKLLLDKGSNLGIKNFKGETPILSAIFAGRKEIAYFFLKNGVASDIFIECGLDRLTQVIELLKREPDSINSRMKNGFTPLHVAAFLGKKRIVKFLISKNVDINSEDEGKMIPLYYAVSNGYKDVVDILLKNGKIFTFWTQMALLCSILLEVLKLANYF